GSSSRSTRQRTARWRVPSRAIQTYLETQSMRAAAIAAFPTLSRANATRKGRRTLELAEVRERLAELAGEDEAALALVPSGATARLRIKSKLWVTANRCLQLETDPSTQKARADLRKTHRLRLCAACEASGEPSCDVCAHNTQVFESLVE